MTFGTESRRRWLVYHGDAPWGGPTCFHDLLDPVVREVPELLGRVPQFELMVDDLTLATDEQLRARAFGAYGLQAAAFLRDARHPERVLPMLDTAYFTRVDCPAFPAPAG